jgi:hypothetical protein
VRKSNIALIEGVSDVEERVIDEVRYPIDVDEYAMRVLLFDAVSEESYLS